MSCFLPAYGKTSQPSPESRIAFYRQQLELNPKAAQVRMRLAACLSASGEFAEATQTYAEIDGDSLKTIISQNLVALGLLDADPLATSSVPPIEDEPPLIDADTLCGADHYRLGSELLLENNRLGALNEFCLALKCRKPTIQGWREVGNLLSEHGNYYLSTNAFARYLRRATDALDYGTIAGKADRLRQRYGTEIATAMTELAAGGPLQVTYSEPVRAATGVAATRAFRNQTRDFLANARIGLH